MAGNGGRMAICAQNTAFDAEGRGLTQVITDPTEQTVLKTPSASKAA